MPTYDYNCEECGADFELRLKFSDDVEQPWGECGSVAKRQFSAVPIVFKGSGWYVNDYGKKSSASGNSGDAATTDQSDKSANTENKSEKATSSDSSSESASKPSKDSASKSTSKSSSKPSSKSSSEG